MRFHSLSIMRLMRATMTLDHLPLRLRPRARTLLIIHIIATSITACYLPLLLSGVVYQGALFLAVCVTLLVMGLLGMSTCLTWRGHVNLSIHLLNLLLVLGVAITCTTTGALTSSVWMLALGGLLAFFVLHPLHVVLLTSVVMLSILYMHSLFAGVIPGEFLRDELAHVMLSTFMISVLAFMKSNTHLRLSKQLDDNRKATRHATARAEQHRAQLLSLLHHAEAADRAKSRFLAEMSHELRNPLNAILGYTELLREDLDEHPMLPDTVISDTEMIQIASNHLISLIQEVLDLDEIEQGELRFRPDTFDLVEISNEVLVAMNHAATQHGNTLLFTCEQDTLLIHQDSTWVRQVLFNFISNAIKFTKDGRIELVVQRASPDRILLCVMDSGMGMTAEDLHMIREEFTQSTHQSVKEFGGTGLGLPLCYTLIEEMGGTLHIESIPRQGTTLTVELPVHREAS